MTSEPADALSGLQAEARRLEEVASRAEEALAATRAGIEEVRAQRARLIWERTEDPDELTRTLEELSARIEGLERAERSREVESIEARTRADEIASTFAETVARRRRWGELRDRMAPTRSTAELHPVAGCLFEVSLPPGRVVTETWHVLDGADGDEPPGTTLLAVIPPGSSVAGVAGRLPEPGTVIWRFRFRAEREGRMTLRFERRNELGQPTATYWVELGVAPEKLAEDP